MCRVTLDIPVIHRHRLVETALHESDLGSSFDGDRGQRPNPEAPFGEVDGRDQIPDLRWQAMEMRRFELRLQRHPQEVEANAERSAQNSGASPARGAGRDDLPRFERRARSLRGEGQGSETSDRPKKGRETRGVRRLDRAVKADRNGSRVEGMEKRGRGLSGRMPAQPDRRQPERSSEGRKTSGRQEVPLRELARSNRVRRRKSFNRNGQRGERRQSRTKVGPCKGTRRGSGKGLLMKRQCFLQARRLSW